MTRPEEQFAIEHDVLARLLAEPDQPTVLLAAAEHLSVRLRGIDEDKALWNRLRGVTDPGTAMAGHQLAPLLALDWQPMLQVVRYVPPPPPELVGWELNEAVRRGLDGDPAGWDDLRESIRGLAGQLDAHRARPATTDRRWRRRLAGLVGHAWNVVRRIDVTAVLIESLTSPVTDVAKGTAAVLAGLSFGLPGVLATLAAGTAIALVKELRKAAQSVAAEDDEQLWTEIVYSPSLAAAAAGQAKSELGLLGLVGAQDATFGPADLPEEVEAALDRLRGWAAGVGAELGSASVFVALDADAEAVHLFDQASGALQLLRHSLDRFRQAATAGNTDGVHAATVAATGAVDDLEDLIGRIKRHLEIQHITHSRKG